MLDYRSALILHDSRGAHATLERKERIRFLQDGVSAILDHAWGDGIVVTSYATDAGEIIGTLRDDGRRHFVIGLNRPMQRGETFEFKVLRELAGSFAQEEEWLETTIDHPIRQLTCNVVFPVERPCKRAVFDDGQSECIIPIIKGSNGHTLIHIHKSFPQPHVTYTLRWSW